VFSATRKCSYKQSSEALGSHTNRGAFRFLSSFLPPRILSWKSKCEGFKTFNLETCKVEI